MRTVWCVAVMCLSASLTVPAFAQTARPTSTIEGFDLAGYFGRAEHAQRDASPYDQWYGVWTGGASAGYYWTDHHKTEIGFTGTTANRDLSNYTFVVIPGTPVLEVNTYTTTAVRTQRLSVLQEYQFFRNAMVHPFAGAGVAISWDRHEITTDESVYARRLPANGGFTDLVSQTVTVSPPQTDVSVHAVATAGIKAYFNERVFFRGDVLVGAWRRFDTFAWKIGCGIDF